MRKYVGTFSAKLSLPYKEDSGQFYVARLGGVVNFGMAEIAVAGCLVAAQTKEARCYVGTRTKVAGCLFARVILPRGVPLTKHCLL